MVNLHLEGVSNQATHQFWYVQEFTQSLCACWRHQAGTCAEALPPVSQLFLPERPHVQAAQDNSTDHHTRGTTEEADMAQHALTLSCSTASMLCKASSGCRQDTGHDT